MKPGSFDELLPESKFVPLPATIEFRIRREGFTGLSFPSLVSLLLEFRLMLSPISVCFVSTFLTVPGGSKSAQQAAPSESEAHF